MCVWLPVLIAIFTVSAGIAAQFYFKWVPDVEEQKRHLRSGFWWTVDVIGIGGRLGSLIALDLLPGSASRVDAAVAGLAGGFFALMAILVLLRRVIFAQMAGSARAASEVRGDLIPFFMDFTEALAVIAEDPNLSTGTKEALSAVLFGAEEARPAIPAVGSDTDSN